MCRSASTFLLNVFFRCVPLGSRHRATHVVCPSRRRFSTLAMVASSYRQEEAVRCAQSADPTVAGVTDEIAELKLSDPLLSRPRTPGSTESDYAWLLTRRNLQVH